VERAALKRNLLTAAVLAGIFGLLVLFASPQYRQGEASIAGTPAHDFHFTLQGQPKTLADLRGKIVVLNFWATWCPPCVEETPSLNRLQGKLAASGVTILAVSEDEDANAYQQFLQSQHVAFPTYHDASLKIAASYGTSVYPETYIIDRRGRIARKIIGPQDWDSPDLVSYIISLSH
jgi:cytochrome c biogenesis protein CcmG, thiol:disulfide interchange protein DsbE